MAYSLRNLFSVEADFEDEDFLLAVEDTETRDSDPSPISSRCLSPFSHGLRAPSDTFRPAQNLDTSGLSGSMSPVLQMQNCSKLRFGTGNRASAVESSPMPCCPGVTHCRVQQDPATFAAQHRSSCSSGTKFKFVHRHPAVLLPESALHGADLDKDFGSASCANLEQSDKQLDLGHPGSGCGSRRQKEDSHVNDVAIAKKPRVANPGILTTPVGAETLPLQRTTQETVGVGGHFQPAEASVTLTLRPTAVGSCSSQSNSVVSTTADANSNSSCRRPLHTSLDQPVAGGNSPHLSLTRPHSFFLSENTPPRPPTSWLATPSPSCFTSRIAGHGARLLPAYGPPVSSVLPSPTVPQAPCSAAPTGHAQSPVVTNHLVRLVTAAKKTPQPVTRTSLRAKSRRFPGPAGILPQQPDGTNMEEILISTPQTPTHGALAKQRAEEMPASQQSVEDEFGSGPWVAMKTELGLDERDPSCFLRTYSIVMVLRKAALKQLPKNRVPSMAVVLKSLTRANVDAGAVFKDSTGEMQGTIHRLLLEVKENEFKAGSVLLLKQVGVFSPSHRNHYLNVTPKNLVKIYLPGLSSGNEPQLCQELREEMGMVTPQVVSKFCSGPPLNAPARSGLSCATLSENFSQGVSALIKGSSLPDTCGAGHSGSRESCSEAERAELDALDQLLGELPEDFFSISDGPGGL